MLANVLALGFIILKPCI